MGYPIAMALRNTVFADYFYRILERTHIPRIERSLLKPNQVTALGLVLAVFVPVGFYLHPFWGLVFMMFSGCADAMDGLMAKNQGTHSKFGAFLDSSFDRISDFLFLAGFWVLFWKTDRLIPGTALIFTSALFTFMISYMKARVEGLGGTCHAGFMERGMRTLYLVLWALFICILPPARTLVLWAGLILFCLLTLLTVIQRIVYIRSQFNT